jgi:hypothetical protein
MGNSLIPWSEVVRQSSEIFKAAQEFYETNCGPWIDGDPFETGLTLPPGTPFIRNGKVEYA